MFGFTGHTLSNERRWIRHQTVTTISMVSRQYAWIYACVRLIGFIIIIIHCFANIETFHQICSLQQICHYEYIFCRRCDCISVEGVVKQNRIIWNDFSVSVCLHPPSYPCQNGYCVPYSDLCDNYDDCGDNSDEDGCSSGKLK